MIIVYNVNVKDFLIMNFICNLKILFMCVRCRMYTQGLTDLGYLLGHR